MKIYRVLAAIFLSIAISAPALACSCIVPRGSQSDYVRRGYQQATNVYSAYVVSEHRTDGPDSRRIVRMRVLQVWKGDLAPNTWIEVESDSEAGLGCGLAVEVNSAILAYTSGSALTSCTMTGRLDKATHDIPLLNKLAGKRK